MRLRRGDDVAHAVNRRAGISRDELRHAHDQRAAAKSRSVSKLSLYSTGLIVCDESVKRNVSVGRSLCRLGGAHGAARAAVLDDDLLAPRRAGSARCARLRPCRRPGIRRDEAHRLRRPILGPERGDGKCQRANRIELFRHLHALAARSGRTPLSAESTESCSDSIFARMVRAASVSARRADASISSQ